MANSMHFPNTPEEFLEQYSFDDDRRVYTNGSELIQVFRVRQMLDHYYGKPTYIPTTTKQARELADITMYVIGECRISASEIMRVYRIGNRAYRIIDTLEKMGIVSEKHANQPRTVLITSVSDLSEEVISFLKRFNYTEVSISNTLDHK